MGRMEDYAETFVRRYTNRDTDQEERRHKKAPPSRFPRENKENTEDKAPNNMTNARVANEEHTRLVTITDRPANKVWMGLAA